MNYDLSYIVPIFPFLAAFLSFCLGIFVFLRNPSHPANIGFGLGMFSLSMIESGNAMFILSNSGHSTIFYKRLSLAGESILPATWFLFSLTFARANYREILARWKIILITLYTGALFFISLLKSPAFFFPPPDSNTYDVLLLGPVGKYFYIFFLLGMVINLIHLENTLRFSINISRRHIKYLIIGAGAIFSFQIYLASKSLLFSTINAGYIPVTSAVILISSGLMMFAIVKQRLLNVDIFLSRYVIYNSFTVLFVGIYLLVVGLFAQAIKMAGGSFETFWSTLFTFTALLGIVGAILSTRLRRKVQLFISRHFYRQKHEFRDKWMETIEKIGAQIDLSKIQKSLVDMISENMGAKEVYLWLYDPVHHRYNMVTSTISSIGQLEIKENHPLIPLIKRHLIPFFIKDILEEERNNEVDEITSLVIATKAILCTPLIVGGGDLVGFILQGKDISRESYKKDDLDLLKAIASHGASRIKNIYLTQDVLAAKEAEAFHQVSSFFIHDLKNLVSPLSLLVQNAEDHMSNPSFQQDAMRTLKGMVSKMNTMISNLTLLSRGLRINPKPLNLNVVIEETLSTLNGQISSQVTKRLENLPSILADGEQLRKVFFNLLLNAIEASPPGREIEVKSFAKNGEVIFTVADQGCGISHEFIQSSLFRPFRTTKPNGLGIGLFQCKKIVESHSGRIEVESEPGKGSIFRVILPSEKPAHPSPSPLP